MTGYPRTLREQFPQAMKALAARVSRLESRTASIDSGQPFAVLPATIDPGYTSGSPQAYVNGSAVLTGPYQVLGSYVPTAGDSVLALPVQGTYVILGITGAPPSWTALTLGNSWANSGSGPHGQYRVRPGDPNRAEIIGDLTGGTMTDGTVIATLPAGARPGTAQTLGVVIPGTGAAANMRLFVATSGSIECEGMSALTAPRVTFHDFIDLTA